jgi:hypothetical protein
MLLWPPLVPPLLLRPPLAPPPLQGLRLLLHLVRLQ